MSASDKFRDILLEAKEQQDSEVKNWRQSPPILSSVNVRSDMDTFGKLPLSIPMGYCEMKGNRSKMEDCTCVLDAAPYLSLVAVIDGHSGIQVTEWMKYNGLQLIAKNLLELGEDPKPKKVRQVLKDSFANDEKVPNLYDEIIKINHQDSGAAITVLVFTKKYIFVANLGDCRAMLIKHVKDKYTAVRLTIDHKAKVGTKEAQKVISRGGTVDNCGVIDRVNCHLAITRALGDLSLGNVLGRRPQISFIPRSAKSFTGLVIGSDGLWDTLNDQAVAGWIGPQVHNKAPEVLARELVSTAYNRGSEDNITAVVVPLSKLIFST